jgi:hypothetical protein
MVQLSTPILLSLLPLVLSAPTDRRSTGFKGIEYPDFVSSALIADRFSEVMDQSPGNAPGCQLIIGVHRLSGTSFNTVSVAALYNNNEVVAYSTTGYQVELEVNKYWGTFEKKKSGWAWGNTTWHLEIEHGGEQEQKGGFWLNIENWFPIVENPTDMYDYSRELWDGLPCSSSEFQNPHWIVCDMKCESMTPDDPRLIIID